MQRLLLVLAICGFCVLSLFAAVVTRWARHHRMYDGNTISVNIRETDEKYQVLAYYKARKAEQLQRYLNQHLHTDHIFRHRRMHGNVILDDQTRLYVDSKPGRLLIRFNKDENSEEAYRRIKVLGANIKYQVTEN